MGLSRLSTLPSRQIEPGTEDIARDAMYRGLAGVTKHGLEKAIDAVLQNKLGHGFFPSPPELRGLCDKAMEHHERMRDQVRRRERLEAERIPERAPLTEAEKQRQRERMKRFNRAIGRDEEATERDFIAEMEAKYGREALAAVADNPRRFDVPGFRKAG